jgi:8-oxo-dGTP diphosphatase
MKSYVVGFIFNHNLTRVVLVTKARPDWQKGHQNGVGGKIEEGERAVDAMVRETEEETGLITSANDWHPVVSMKRVSVTVEFFALCHVGAEEMVRTTTDEVVAWYDVSSLPRTVLSNLTWMIPLAIDRFSDTTVSSVAVVHTDDR